MMVRNLLDSRLQHAQNQEHELAKIKSLFVYDVDFLAIEELDLSAHQRRLLLQQQAVIHDIGDTEFLSLQSKLQPDRVWRLQFEDHEFKEEHNLIIGPVKLFEQELQQYPHAHMA